MDVVPRTSSPSVLPFAAAAAAARRDDSDEDDNDFDQTADDDVCDNSVGRVAPLMGARIKNWYDLAPKTQSNYSKEIIVERLAVALLLVE